MCWVLYILHRDTPLTPLVRYFAGELDEHEALMLLEHKNLTKTATELRMLLADIDKNKDRQVNFLEWCCFVFQKPWEELNNFVDEDARYVDRPCGMSCHVMY